MALSLPPALPLWLGSALAGEPTCFPLSLGVAALVEGDRLDGPVFVEELSRCDDARPAGVPARPAPEGARGRRALRALVDAQADGSPVRYAVERRAGGWLVAPVGVDRWVDVPVSLTDDRPRNLWDVELELFAQVYERRGVWVPPVGVAFGGHPPHSEVAVAPFPERPLLEALRAVFDPLDPPPVAFTLRRHPVVDGAAGARGLLVPLYPEGPDRAPMWDGGVLPPGRPTCDPLTRALGALVAADRLDGRPLFVEERSACTPERPDGVPSVEVPPGLRGRDALVAAVEAHAGASAARYEVLERAGGWLVAPVGEDRLFDVPVRFGDRWGAMVGIQLGQLGLSFPSAQNPFGRGSWADLSGPAPAPIDERPLLEALVALVRPLLYVPTGFALVHRPEPSTDGVRAGLSILSPLGP